MALTQDWLGPLLKRANSQKRDWINIDEMPESATIADLAELMELHVEVYKEIRFIENEQFPAIGQTIETESIKK